MSVSVDIDRKSPILPTDIPVCLRFARRHKNQRRRGVASTTPVQRSRFIAGGGRQAAGSSSWRSSTLARRSLVGGRRSSGPACRPGSGPRGRGIAAAAGGPLAAAAADAVFVLRTLPTSRSAHAANISHDSVRHLTPFRHLTPPRPKTTIEDIPPEPNPSNLPSRIFPHPTAENGCN